MLHQVAHTHARDFGPFERGRPADDQALEDWVTAEESEQGCVGVLGVRHAYAAEEGA